MKTNNPSWTILLTILRVLVAGVLTFTFLRFGELWLKSLGVGELSWIIPVVLVYLGLGLFAKHAVLASIPERYEIRPMTATEFAQAQGCSIASDEPIPAPTSRPKAIRNLDLPRIENLTVELQSLGFHLAREGHLQPDKPNKQAIYVRIFEHPTGASASLMQIFTAAVVLPVVFSVENAFEDRWNWSDSNLKRNWLTFMMRRPRALGKFHPIESGATALWASCQETSAKIERELGAKRRIIETQHYETYLAQSLSELKAAFRRKNIFIGIFEGIFVLPRTTEWWGEYAKHVNKANG